MAGFSVKYTGGKELVKRLRKLEDGGLPLDQGMKLFEEGAKLTIQLNKQLDTAEQKVQLMMEKADGTSEERPFEEEQV